MSIIIDQAINIANKVKPNAEAFDALAVKTNTSDRSLEKILMAHGIYRQEQIEWYDKFCRFGCLDVVDSVTTTREYIFFTKPDLHIFNGTNMNNLNSELSNIPLWRDAFTRYREVLGQLQLSANSPNNVFVNLLTNSVNSSLDLPGITAGDVETNENIYGTHMTYRKSSLTTDEHHDFTLEFTDTKYTEVYAWFRLYDAYCTLKDLGMVTPVFDSYTLDRILYDQMAVYKFIVGEDGETLVYWAKLWGVYPKSVPRDAFSDMSSLSNGLKLSVNFHGIFVDDFDPTILAEFNQIVLNNGVMPTPEQILPIYDFSIGAVSGEWAGLPFIAKNSKTTNNDVYKLKWRRA